MKKLFPLVFALLTWFACDTTKEEMVLSEKGKTAKINFSVGGEVSNEQTTSTRASSIVYEIFIDEKNEETVTPYLYGTFSSLQSVIAELPIGKTYLVAIQVDMNSSTSVTNSFTQTSRVPAIHYDSSRGYTHYSCDSYLQKDVYYGEAVTDITNSEPKTITINAQYCGFGLKFNVTKPLGGTLTAYSENPEFLFTYSADEISDFPTDVVCYTMKHPWAEDEEITIFVSYSQDNFNKEVKIIPKRNKAVRLNINLNPETSTLSFSFSFESVEV